VPAEYGDAVVAFLTFENVMITDIVERLGPISSNASAGKSMS